MNKRMVLIAVILVSLAVIMAVVPGGSTKKTLSLNPDFSMIQTAAVGTFASNLTQTASLRAAFDSSPAPTITASLITVASNSSETPTPSCYHLRWIKDVTIPDFSKMKPGEAFTKTWRVVNNGTCAWKAGFQFAFYGGDAMGGTNYVLPQVVNAGAQMDLSIPMTAPSGTGVVIGTWRMSGPNGWFFGDALTVKIDLGGETPTP